MFLLRCYHVWTFGMLSIALHCPAFASSSPDTTVSPLRSQCLQHPHTQHSPMCVCTHTHIHTPCYLYVHIQSTINSHTHTHMPTPNHVHTTPSQQSKLTHNQDSNACPPHQGEFVGSKILLHFIAASTTIIIYLINIGIVQSREHANHCKKNGNLCCVQTIAVCRPFPAPEVFKYKPNFTKMEIILSMHTHK